MNFICHHGIKGQKWGVRRYQNKDGSYTAEGKKRYNSDSSGSSKKTKKGLTDKQKKYIAIGVGVVATAAIGVAAYKFVKDPNVQSQMRKGLDFVNKVSGKVKRETAAKIASKLSEATANRDKLTRMLSLSIKSGEDPSRIQTYKEILEDLNWQINELNSGRLI